MYRKNKVYTTQGMVLLAASNTLEHLLVGEGVMTVLTKKLKRLFVVLVSVVDDNWLVGGFGFGLV